MTRDEARKCAEVMMAYANGAKVEYFFPLTGWEHSENPSFCWGVTPNYRIAVTPESIDWSHVSTEYNYMARDEGGECYLYSAIPGLGAEEWTQGFGSLTEVDIFASYKRGTVDWKSSLVKRPGLE